MSDKKSQLHLAKDAARILLDTNNAAWSSVSDKLFSVLESGEGDLYIRDQIDHALDQFYKSKHTADVWYDRNELRKFLSIKDKIAYVTGAYYATKHVDPNSSTLVIDAKLRKKLHELTYYLEKKLLSNKDFTESRSLRHAAFNRYGSGLDVAEQASINTIAGNLKKVAQTNNFETLAEATHFTNETDAQKIMKLTEVARQLTAYGVALDKDLLGGIQKLEEKIKPLKDLDKCYKHLINMLNMTYDIAKIGYPSMIGQNEQKTLKDILGERWKKEEDFLIKALDKKDPNQFQLLEKKFVDLESDSIKYKELLSKYKIKPNQFKEWFLVYFTYQNVKKAKGDLNQQKTATFGEHLKDYEGDTRQWRGTLRNRIFDIGSRMRYATDPLDEVGKKAGRGFGRWERRFWRFFWWHHKVKVFKNDEDYHLAENYFDKFQNLFYANERDAYSDGRDKVNHYETMLTTTSAILRRKYPALCTGKHGRYWSLPRKCIKWLEWFAKGQEEKWFFKMLRRYWKNGDHADILASVIMMQNQAQQQMFHSNDNPFQIKDGKFKKIFQGLWLAEESRQKLGETISPYTNKLMKIAEVSLTTVGSPIGKSAEKVQESFKKSKWIKKVALSSLLPAAWLASWVKWAYTGVKKYLAEVQGKDVNYLYESVADAVDGVTSAAAKTVAAGGNKMYDITETAQQKSVLGTFFALASEDKKWKGLLESSDLQNLFNFQNRETYLFDDDGRVQMIDKGKIKEKNTPEWSGKEFAEKLDKQIEKLIKQSDDNFEDKKKKNKEANINWDSKKKIETDIDLNSANVTKNNVKLLQNDLSKLVPIFKKPLTWTSNYWRWADITTTINSINITLNDPTNGLITKIKSNIWNTTTAWTLEYDTNTALHDTSIYTGQVSTYQNNVKSYQTALAQRWANFATIQPLLAAEILNLQTAEQNKNNAELKYIEKSRELFNAKQQLLRLENIEEIIKKINDINTKMSAALPAPTTPPTIPTGDPKAISEELLQLAKHLDILLYPEEISDSKDSEKLAKIKSITSRTDIDEKEKSDLISTLMAA